jgi:signal peptide peptidase SppA
MTDTVDIVRAIASAARAPMLIDARRADQINAIAVAVAKGEAISAALLLKSAASTIIAPGRGNSSQSGSIGFVGMHGIATYDCEYQPYCYSTRLLARSVNQFATDDSVKTIVLDIDSPGGAVTGTQEAADAVFAARGKKPVIALVNSLAASAAYWIASQATQIVGVPSADVGSIGVFMLHMDYSGMLKQEGIKPTFIFAGKHKIEANPYEPLVPTAKTYLQSEVDTIYAAFIANVARGRRTSTANVQANFGQGRCVMASAAMLAGMLDRIEALDAAVSWIIAASGGNRSLSDVMSAALSSEEQRAARRRRMRILRQ